jgi:hypothetical protein
VRTPAIMGQLCLSVMLLAAPAAAAETLLTGPVGVTLEQGPDGPRVILASRWLSPVELWDSEAKAMRVYVLEEVSRQSHQFLGEVPEGSMTLALYPLQAMALLPARWQATLPAQAGAVVRLDLWDPYYEVTYGGHAYAQESRQILSLRTGQELVVMTQPVATLYRDGEPPGQWLAGLHVNGTVRDAELFGPAANEGVLLTLADPERQTDRVRVLLDEPSLAPLAGTGELVLGFAAGAGAQPTLRLVLGAGDPAPRLVLQVTGSVGAVIPLGPNGLALSQAVTRGLRLERVGP